MRPRKVKFTRSMALFEEALDVLPAGVSSNARLWKTICPNFMPCSLFIARAKGSHIWDVDGNEYIDYRLGYGPVILGHSYRPILSRVRKAEQTGLVFALSHELEVRVAKKIRQIVPCAEMVRFSNTGTEATMHALRIARAFTGREKVVKFEGHYHGAHDYLLFSTEPPFNMAQKNSEVRAHFASRGIPKAIEKLVLVQRWNHFDAIEKTVRKHGDEIAAIITEPVMGNSAVIMPKDGYLQHLRKLCDDHGIVLIFDEVKTGFRLDIGGAQRIFGVKPDMATFSKSLGNGYPVAAIVGKREIMENVGPQKVVHGGTFASNPIALTAADATLDELNKPRIWAHFRGYGKQLVKGLADIFTDARVPFLIQGAPTMFQLLFTRLHAVWEYRDLEHCDMKLYAQLHYELLRRGVMIDEDNEEPIFTCYSHTKEDLQHTLEAFKDALPAARVPRSLLPVSGTSQIPTSEEIDTAERRRYMRRAEAKDARQRKKIFRPF